MCAKVQCVKEKLIFNYYCLLLPDCPTWKRTGKTIIRVHYLRWVERRSEHEKRKAI